MLLAITLCAVVAQDIGPVFDMGTLTNTLAQGAVVKSERDRAIRMGKGDPLRGKTRKANPSVLTFRPSLAARKRNLEAFAARIGAVDPAGAQGLRQSYAKGDVIAQATPILRSVGLDPNNVADAMAAYLVTAWHGARGDDKGTRAEYRAVGAQLARVVAANPAMARVSNAVKQETAESMILNALLVDASVTDAMKNPAKLPGVKDAVAQGARRTFGFDLAKMRLGARGLY